MRLPPVCVDVERRCRQKDPVDGRIAILWRAGVGELQQLFGGQCTQRCTRRCADLGGKCRGKSHGVCTAVRRHGAQHRRARAHRLGKQSLALWAGHQQTDRYRSGRFTDDGYPRWITAECRDIGLNPAQCGNLIEVAVVANAAVCGCTLRVCQKSEHAQTVVHGDRDDTLGSQCRAIVAWLRAVAGDVAAAIEVDQHG